MEGGGGCPTPKTWLFGIARHVGIDEIRKRKRLKLKDKISIGKEHEPKEEVSAEGSLSLLMKPKDSLQSNTFIER